MNEMLRIYSNDFFLLENVTIEALPPISPSHRRIK